MTGTNAREGVRVGSSGIGGRGVFAARAFAAGERVRDVRIAREVTESEPLGPDEDPQHAFLSDGRYLLVGAPDRYLNHSCDPNAYLRYVGDRIELVARRAIAAGAEITLDYLINNSGGDTWPCHCGAPRCRGRTAKSFFHLPDEVQREYRPLLADWFVRRHVSELARLD